MKKILFDLLSLYSSSGKESAVVEYLKKFFHKLDIPLWTDQVGNCYARLAGHGEPILLTAHLDTISNGIVPEPFEENGIIRSKNKSILGLDDKASVSVILELVKSLIKAGRKYRPFEIVFTVREEPGCMGAKYLLEHGSFDLKSKVGLCFDFPQPVGSILSGAAGIWRGSIEFLGKAAHSARPEEGKNALIVANQWARAYLSERDKSKRKNIGFFYAGGRKQFNLIPDYAELELEIRSFDDIKEEYSRLAKSFFGYEVKIRQKEEFTRIQSYRHQKNDPWIYFIKKQMCNQVIEPNEVAQSFGASDANIFQEHGINVVVLGNGVKETHSVNEHVAFIDLQKLYLFLYKFFLH